MVVFSTFVWASEAPVSSAAPTASSVQGEVLEVRDVENYTYLRLHTGKGEVWAAVGTASVKKGAQVTIENAMTMHDFKSKSLKRTFKTIIFGRLAGVGGKPSSVDMAAAHAVKMTDTGKIEVARAVGANAHTVEEIISHASEMKDKPVVLRGKVVKYNPGIMGKNWLHLRDGTGSDAKNTNDILVTSASQVQSGDVVTVKGVVRTDKDFGAGYSYKVMIEEATLQP